MSAYKLSCFAQLFMAITTIIAAAQHQLKLHPLLPLITRVMMVETTTLVAVAPLALLVPPLLLWACWSLLAYSWLQPSFWALSSTRKIGGRLRNL